MNTQDLQRAWMRGALAAGGLLNGPLEVEGQRMDKRMSALVRFANRTRLPFPLDLERLRHRYAGAHRLTGARPERTVRVTAVEAGGRPARVYEPPTVPHANMLFFHGGGFIMGGLDTHDRLCRRLARRAGLRIVAVDYRLAPEHPFPAAHEDAARAWDWARAQGGGKWVVGGDSAGGNLAAGLARDGSARLQVLLYPAVDLRHEDERYPSVRQFWEGFLLTAEGLQECVRLLLPPGQDTCDVRADPRLSPIRADLSKASPALLVVAGFDPLRDQARAYARALQNAGRRAHVLEEDALPHGFADFAGVVPAAKRAVDRVAAAIQAELRQ